MATTRRGVARRSDDGDGDDRDRRRRQTRTATASRRRRRRQRGEGRRCDGDDDDDDDAATTTAMRGRRFDDDTARAAATMHAGLLGRSGGVLGFQRRCDAMQAEHAGQRSEHGDDATMTMTMRRRRRRGDNGATTARRARIAVRMRIAVRIRSGQKRGWMTTTRRRGGDSLWGGCSSAPLYDSYRPQFET